MRKSQTRRFFKGLQNLINPDQWVKSYWVEEIGQKSLMFLKRNAEGKFDVQSGVKNCIRVRLGPCLKLLRKRAKYAFKFGKVPPNKASLDNITEEGLLVTKLPGRWKRNKNKFNQPTTCETESVIL